MKENNNIFVMNSSLDLYLKEARKQESLNNMVNAKKNYLLAAEVLMKMALTDTPELKKARLTRAKNMIAYADSLASAKTAVDSGPIETIKAKEPSHITLDEALDKLNSLIGLDSVKAQVKSWVDQINVFKIRKERGLKIPDMSYHLVFSGNPGTGKTTIARIISDIYYALGIVKNGQLVEVERNDLVAGYIGQTAIKTKACVDKAIGGVLFIDEAYTLNSGISNDFGQEAIDTILKQMEDNRDNLVVIVAGYTDLMKKFVRSNPGLESRFKTYIEFKDYTDVELYKIFKLLCDTSQYIVDNESSFILKKYFENLVINKPENFANGRDVRNLFEIIISKQASRVAKNTNLNDMEISLIKRVDIPDYIIDSFITNEKTIITEPEYIESEEDNKLDIKETENKESEKKKSKLDEVLEKCDEDEPKEEIIPKPEEEILNGADNDSSEFSFKWDDIPKITFEDVAGLDDVKNVVKMKVLLPLKNPEIFEGYEKKNGGGLLLYGPPGTGKTMIAAAIAAEIKAKFCNVKPSDLLHQGAGNTEKAVRSLFAQARKFPCAVIYFDEMDSISPKSTKSQYAKQLRSEFLAQLQGVESYGKETGNILFLIAATNKPWDIDSAFIRPGRFGTRIYVGLPDAEARTYMINKRLEKIRAKGKVTVNSDIDVADIAEKTNGFNGSDMSNLLDSVEEISIERALDMPDNKYISYEDFNKALEKISTSVQKDDIIRIRIWEKEL